MGGGQYDERRVCDFLTGGEGSVASVHDCGGDLPCGAQLHGEWKHGATGFRLRRPRVSVLSPKYLARSDALNNMGIMRWEGDTLSGCSTEV